MPASWMITIRDVLLRITNILTYVYFFTSDIRLGLPTRPPETYFSSGIYPESLWLLLRYWLLIGYQLYQFFPGAKPLIIDAIGWKFPILTILASMYNNARVDQDWVLAFALAVPTCLWATYILFVINAKNSHPIGFNEVLWIYVSLAAYQAAFFGFVFDNAFLAFSVRKRYDPDVNTQIHVVLALFALFAMCILYTILFRNPAIELPAGSMLIVTLDGVVERQANDTIHVSAFLFLALACLWIVVRLVMFGWFSRYGGNSEGHNPEREPLLAQESALEP